jgi:N-acetylglutamate synthase-like GNAT family acetyltransferase
MVTIREGIESDVGRVNDFYTSQRRSRGAETADFLLLAESDNLVVGVVRLCQEQGYLMLRGMLIERDHRRKGLGVRMLRDLEKRLRDQDCYCIPYAHLIPFYGIIGFQAVEDDEVPDFLSGRLAKYQHNLNDPKIQRLMQDDLGVYPPDGLKFIVMMRSKG